MSYCRLGEDSDVYVWPLEDGRVMCQWCPLGADTVLDRTKMLDHLKAHRLLGHKVPERAIERLERELAGDPEGIG